MALSHNNPLSLGQRDFHLEIARGLKFISNDGVGSFPYPISCWLHDHSILNTFSSICSLGMNFPTNTIIFFFVLGLWHFNPFLYQIGNALAWETFQKHDPWKKLWWHAISLATSYVGVIGMTWKSVNDAIVPKFGPLDHMRMPNHHATCHFVGVSHDQ